MLIFIILIKFKVLFNFKKFITSYRNYFFENYIYDIRKFSENLKIPWGGKKFSLTTNK